jgi:hypothetical protein
MSRIPFSSIPNKSVRKLKFKQLAEKYTLEKIPEDMEVCWGCFMDITKADIDEWRAIYSEDKVHPATCPLCGYDHWKGRVWYPFKFLKDVKIGNPSERYPKRKTELIDGLEMTIEAQDLHDAIAQSGLDFAKLYDEIIKRELKLRRGF